jgi:hypothetical protein
MIGRGELKINLVNMEAIINWKSPINVTKVRNFVGVIQYIQNFMASFLDMATPLHAIKINYKSFQWGKNRHKYCYKLK